MKMLIELALLAAGFFMLAKGADTFVDGAAGLAYRLGVPQIVVGLTIVAMGTSAPEAAISISSSLKGSADIAVGNVVGSNIMNIMLILGITAIITPLAMKKNTIRYEIPFLLVISTVFSLMGLLDGKVTVFDGIILWMLFMVYFAYLFVMTRKGDVEAESSDIDPNTPVVRLLVLVVAGAAMIIFGSDITVNAATELARILGMSERFIGLTIVAFGTSLPELVTCVIAGLKKNADIAIGNIVGSNIFNILFVIGTSALITPVAYQSQFLFDSLIMVAVVALLYILSRKENRLTRTGGIIMLACYAAYFIYLL